MKRMKTGGRKKGTPNKVHGKGREILAGFLEKYLDGGFEVPGGEVGAYVCFKYDITSPNLTPKERLTFIKDIMQYVYPKMQSVEMEATVESVDPLTERLIELTGSDEQNDGNLE